VAEQFKPDFRDARSDLPENYNDLPEQERRSISDERTRLLHIYSQLMWHSDASIIGNRNGLTVLRDAIDDALQNGKSETHAMVSDGEGFLVSITMENHPWHGEAWKHISMPYTDPTACGRRDPNWDIQMLKQALRKANAELVKRAVKPIPDPTDK
jgi:hypothetical protein